MKKLEVGMTFEVVEVLDYGFSDETLFKIGGFTTGLKIIESYIKCMGNGSKFPETPMSKLFMGTCYLNMMIGTEIKPIGRLIIKSVK